MTLDESSASAPPDFAAGPDPAIVADGSGRACRASRPAWPWWPGWT